MQHTVGVGVLLFVFSYYGECSHFRGGTISWKPIHGHTVRQNTPTKNIYEKQICGMRFYIL